MEALAESADAFQSPRASKAPSGRSLASTCVPLSPIVWCTPVKPLWEKRCEYACLACPYPTHFARDSGDKAQDRLVVDVQPGLGGGALWAVFDGHRTSEVAALAASSVPSYVWDSPHWPSAPDKALCDALRECHEEARQDRLKGGSTAVVLAAAGDDLWCCSAGDSRVVACLRDGTSRRLSVEHTAELPGEVDRVLRAGGSVEGGRLEGLPMFRGLGNFNTEADGFACLPDVRRIPRADADFVVVASDGLWDVLPDEECCALVRRCGGVGVAEHLVDAARRLGSADDIAVVVVFFPEHQQTEVAKLDDAFAAAEGRAA